MSWVCGSCTTLGQATYLLLMKLASEPHPCESVHLPELLSDTSVSLSGPTLPRGSAAALSRGSATLPHSSAPLSQVDYYGNLSSKNSTAWIVTIDGH